MEANKMFVAAALWTTLRAGQAAKNRITKWTENGVRRQHEREGLAAQTEISDLHKKEQNSHENLEENLCMEIRSKETACAQKLEEESAKIAQVREEHQEEITALKGQLERSTEDQNEKLLERLRLTEEAEHSARVENEELKEKCKEFQEMATNLAKELGELRSNVEQERDVQHSEIQTLQEQLHTMTCLMEEKEATFQQKVEECAKLEKEQKKQQEEIAALKSRLLRTTSILKENTTTLQQKLTQEEAIRKELVSMWDKQTSDREKTLKLFVDQNDKLLEQLRLTEKSEVSARVENEQLKEKCKEFQEMATNLAKELGELRSNVEPERDVQHSEIQTLQEQLHMMTCLMQEKEAAFQQELMEERSKIAWEREEHQEEIAILVRKLKQERRMMALKRREHREESAARKGQLEKTTILAQQKETTLWRIRSAALKSEKLRYEESAQERKIAEEEAKTAEANAKLSEYKELARFNREHQNYLKEERNSQENLMENLCMEIRFLQEKETACAQELMEERAKIAWEREEHQEEIAILVRKLSEEEALRQELDAKQNKQTGEHKNMLKFLEDENEKLLAQLRLTEEAELYARVENEELEEKCKEFQEMATNLAKELGELRSNIEPERDVQHSEIQTLQEQLHMMNCLMEEKEATFQQELMAERSKIAWEREEHQEEIAILLRKLKQERRMMAQKQREQREEIYARKGQLEKTTILAQQKETTLRRIRSAALKSEKLRYEESAQERYR